MKRLFLLALIAPIALQAQLKDVQVSGLLKGLPDNSVVELRTQDEEAAPVATASSKSGRFVLKGKIAEADIHSLSVKGVDAKAFLFLEPGKISVTGHKDSMNALVSTGSETQLVFEAFNREFSPLYAKASQISQKMSSGPDADGSITKEFQSVMNEIEEKTDRYVDRYSSSPVTPFAILVNSQMSEDAARMESRYARLTPAARESKYGKILGSTVADAKVGAVGTMATDFTQNDPDGNPVTLSSLRGKYVLVDFWASWCKPCRDENPNVVDAFNKYKGRNFTVLGVSLDRSKEPWVKAIKDDKLDWTHVSDLKFWNNAVSQQYRISSIPQNLLIDPQGVIIAKNLRGKELQDRLAELFK
jgi:peroxiredoxin